MGQIPRNFRTIKEGSQNSFECFNYGQNYAFHYEFIAVESLPDKGSLLVPKTYRQI